MAFSFCNNIISYILYTVAKHDEIFEWCNNWLNVGKLVTTEIRALAREAIKTSMNDNTSTNYLR